MSIHQEARKCSVSIRIHQHPPTMPSRQLQPEHHLECAADRGLAGHYYNEVSWKSGMPKCQQG